MYLPHFCLSSSEKDLTCFQSLKRGNWGSNTTPQLPSPYSSCTQPCVLWVLMVIRSALCSHLSWRCNLPSISIETSGLLVIRGIRRSFTGMYMMCGVDAHYSHPSVQLPLSTFPTPLRMHTRTWHECSHVCAGACDIQRLTMGVFLDSCPPL